MGCRRAVAISQRQAAQASGPSGHAAAPDLDGRRGTITTSLNPGAYGFVTHKGNKWVRPLAPESFHGKPEKIDLGVLDGESHRIKLPYGSDWAIAVGRFAGIRGDGR